MDAQTKALDEIASGSPSMHAHVGGDHRCSQCLAMINTARVALGFAAWPADPKTPVVTKTETP